MMLHGGPGACGSMAPIARGLADSFLVIKPFQSAAAATVDEHVADLLEVIESHAEGTAPAIVGHSWGAMLALAYAAAHPDLAGPIVLVCSGTFDLASRERLREVLDSRMDASMMCEYERVRQITDPKERLRALGEFTVRLYACDLETTEQEIDESEPGASEETWNDMVRLQTEGVYPRAFAAINSPVLMLHGAEDPHPGQMIRASLEPYLPQLEYREWEQCGHYLWQEKAARHDFFATLREWLTHLSPCRRGD